MTRRLTFRPEARTELLEIRRWYDRRIRLYRYPYAIFCRILDDEVVVLALMHGRRDPRRWQSRR